MIMTIAEKLRRLGEMSLPELRFRVKQRVHIAREKWQLYRNGAIGGDSAPWDYWDAEKVGDATLRAALKAGEYKEATNLVPDYFASRKGPAFFWDAADRDETIASYPRYFPKRTAEIHGEADSLAALRFRIFSYPEVSCGSEICWRKDLVHSVESGLDHHARIPYLDFARVGDSKVVWELNRHQSLLTIALASLLKRDEKFAEVVLTHWESWQEQNPYARGINWASSLEVAFRSWSWLWCLHLLSGSLALTGDRIVKITAALARNAGFIAENLSTYFSPNTHLLGEGFALFCIGLMFPELSGAEGWREQGRTILLQEMCRQVRDDGSHFEQSSYYHRYAAEFFLCAAILAARNASPFPHSYLERLVRMFEFLQSIALPGGRDPMLGDADGGRLIPFGSNDANDFRPLLSTASVFCRRGDFKKTAGDLHEQTLWLLGPESGAAFAALPPENLQETSRSFDGAGMVVMRSDWTEDARFMLFDAGVQGMGGSAHGHADALAVVCSAGGVDWLVDPGTYLYTASRAWRDFFRSTRGHNTLVIDGQDQAKPVDFFKWRDLPAVRRERFVSLPELDFAVGMHNGYARLDHPIEHRRRVLFVKPDYWIISDEIRGTRNHEFEFYFHFAPDVIVRQSGCRWEALKEDRKFILQHDAPALEFHLSCGEESPIQGWYSKDYGHHEPAPVLIGKARAATPVCFHWLLMPDPAEDMEFHGPAQTQSGFTVAAGDWNDTVLFGGSESHKATGGYASNAEVAYLRRDASGQLMRLILVNGSWAELDHRMLVRSKEKVEEIIVNWAGSEPSVRMRPATPFELYPRGTALNCPNDSEAEPFRPDESVEFKGARSVHVRNLRHS
jgi:hypothetical protein